MSFILVSRRASENFVPLFGWLKIIVLVGFSETKSFVFYVVLLLGDLKINKIATFFVLFNCYVSHETLAH